MTTQLTFGEFVGDSVTICPYDPTHSSRYNMLKYARHLRQTRRMTWASIVFEINLRNKDNNLATPEALKLAMARFEKTGYLDAWLEHVTVEVPKVGKYDYTSYGIKEHLLKWQQQQPANTHVTISLRRKRIAALLRISSNIQCCNCGCDLLSELQINHKNGGGNKEATELSLRGKNIITEILSGNRRVDDLEIRCRVCNILHYVEAIRGHVGYYTITFNSKGHSPSPIV